MCQHFSLWTSLKFSLRCNNFRPSGCFNFIHWLSVLGQSLPSSMTSKKKKKEKKSKSENVYCLSGGYGVMEVVSRPHVLPSQIAEHSWDRLEADPAPSPLCKHKRQGRGLPPRRKNGFLKATSCGTALHIQRKERRTERHRCSHEPNCPFSKETKVLQCSCCLLSSFRSVSTAQWLLSPSCCLNITFVWWENAESRLHMIAGYWSYMEGHWQ